MQPAHHYPLGMEIDPERARTLLDWARQHGGLILENDANADVHHDGPGPAALQGRIPDSCLLVGSASRVLAPSLRMGWIVAPPALAATLARHKAIAGPGSPVNDQMAYARFLADGELGRHLAGFGRVPATLGQHWPARWRRAPECSLTGPSSGSHVVVGLPPGSASSRSSTPRHDGG